MNRKKPGNFFSGAMFHFEKRNNQKDEKGEKRSEVILTAKSTIIISISIVILLVSCVTKC